MGHSVAARYNICSKKGTSFAKRKASKAIRQAKDFAIDGMIYRRLFNSWNICDSGKSSHIGPGDEQWQIECRRK